ncbi:homeobox protein VENTX [Mustela erminea]|uniref:homeobox protein VENTX n=1 Tax=Mustela erminea TaxID=36723 RepID=UPI001387232C|nr:homeobox protein VENTX [Mustela erminea]
MSGTSHSLPFGGDLIRPACFWFCPPGLPQYTEPEGPVSLGPAAVARGRVGGGAARTREGLRRGRPPSAASTCGLRGGPKPSRFGSVDWLSQSSRVGPSHTSRPAQVSWRSLSAPARVSSSREFPQTGGTEEKPSEVSSRGTPTAGWSREADALPAPRVRTAFSAEQVSTLESAFQRRRYLGPAERRRLARDMRLSEVQIKTWFQNRRMKHKRQLQDSRLSSPFPGALCPPVPLCSPPSALGSGLQLLCPWASPLGPPALTQPPASMWDPRQAGQASLALAWAPDHRLPPTFCLPDPGGQAHTLGPALSGGPWNQCALPQTGDAF